MLATAPRSPEVVMVVSGTLAVILIALGVVVYIVEWSAKAKRRLSKKPPTTPYGSVKPFQPDADPFGDTDPENR
jgi:hypothetical protein